ncbi:MAG: tRNA glutamyl-Q(34) synthetase GluQRS [Acidimicrobiales bacterium]
MPHGRFAPSPTGRLHLGNLRTALAAWLFARHDGGRFVLRFDDLDLGAVRGEHYRTQPDDLAALGLNWDGEPRRQRDRIDRYRTVIDRLVADSALYPCYCTRREIREAAMAPNSPVAGHAYPGTCRDLDRAGRARREATGRTPAWRFRCGDRIGGREVGFTDRIAGPVCFPVDDFVVARNDGTPAYHLVTVVDDADDGTRLVVRADDLLESTARQLALSHHLGLPVPDHAHVPLVLGPGRRRLAKRDGAVTLPDRLSRGEGVADVLGFLASSLGQWPADTPATATEVLARFDPALLPRSPLVLGRAVT